MVKKKTKDNTPLEEVESPEMEVENEPTEVEGESETSEDLSKTLTGVALIQYRFDQEPKVRFTVPLDGRQSGTEGYLLTNDHKFLYVHGKEIEYPLSVAVRLFQRFEKELGMGPRPYDWLPEPKMDEATLEAQGLDINRDGTKHGINRKEFLSKF